MVQLRNLSVGEVFDKNVMLSLIVDEDETVASMVKKFAETPSIRGIFVVDRENVFKGVITRKTMLYWARIHLGLGLNRTELAYSARINQVLREIMKYAHGTAAKELVNRHSDKIYVKPQDSVICALNLMISSDLIDILVISDERKIIGDLKLNEILNLIIGKSSS